MKPRSFIRALGDCWDIVSTIWSRYETRTLTERELLHIVRPFTIGTDQPEQVAVKRMVDIGILSEFSRGGQGYSLNLQIVPFVQFLLDEQSLGLIEEISANANRLEGTLKSWLRPCSAVAHGFFRQVPGDAVALSDVAPHGRI